MSTRHCWVHVAFLPNECPGLILEWDLGEPKRVLVTYWRDDEARALTEWVTAENLRPARGARSTP